MRTGACGLPGSCFDPPVPLDRARPFRQHGSNAAGIFDLAEAIAVPGDFFLGGDPPAPPGECGSDPEGVDLDCRESACP